MSRPSGSNVLEMPAGPVLTRGRRCENCLNFNSDPLYVGPIFNRSILNDAKNLAVEVLLKREAPESAIDSIMKVRTLPDLANTPVGGEMIERFKVWRKMCTEGMVGICTPGYSGTTVTHAHYFCEKWDQRYKPEGSETPDETGAEARSRLGLDDGEDPS